MPPGDIMALATGGVKNRSRNESRATEPGYAPTQKFETTASNTLVMLCGSLAS
jgi:hypothetical protein